MKVLPDCRSPRHGLGTAPASPVIVFVRTEQLAVPTHLGREVGRVPYACTWFLVGLRPALCLDLALAHSPAVSPSLLIPVSSTSLCSHLCPQTSPKPLGFGDVKKFYFTVTSKPYKTDSTVGKKRRQLTIWDSKKQDKVE